MTRDHHLLAEVGRLLYGPEWISPLARDLAMDLRTLQRWAAGERRTGLPEDIWHRLAGRLRERAPELHGQARRARALARALAVKNFA